MADLSKTSDVFLLRLYRAMLEGKFADGNLENAKEIICARGLALPEAGKPYFYAPYPGAKKVPL